jgi:hypothetical protein
MRQSTKIPDDTLVPRLRKHFMVLLTLIIKRPLSYHLIAEVDKKNHVANGRMPVLMLVHILTGSCI